MTFCVKQEMPMNGSNTQSQKKRSHKKRRHKEKSKSKQRITNANETSDPIKKALNSNRCELIKLTPANVSSLRWDNILTDPILESNRIEAYKELRRQRYIDARQQAVQNLIEQMQITTGNVSEK